MTRKRKLIVRLIAVVLALMMPVVTGVVATAAGDNTPETTNSSLDATKYDSPDINELTGHGKEPEDLSVTAGAEYMEKAWYEYVTYSDKAVASYRLNDDSRLLFYDPYTYTNAMIMDVQFDATTTEFDTMSSYTVSNTISKTINACVSSTDTDTRSTQTSGRDVTYTDVTNGGYTKTTYNHDVNVATKGKVKNETEYSYKDIDTVTEAVTIAGGATTKVGLDGGIETSTSVSSTTTFGKEWVTDKVTDKTIYSDDYKTTTTYSGESKIEDFTTSTTDGWIELSARVTKTLGSSRSTSTSWSEQEGTTITKTYAATHFASDGVTPLPWAIVHYTVEMPMKCVMQVKNSGEWVSISTIYCLLTTVKGTCRAWMQNGQVYYEDWGSGEPVVATDFWAQFMTKEQLMKTYQNKLYPVGGED